MPRIPRGSVDGFIMRYVEGNPVRARLVSSAKEWEWSSHGERIGKVVAERKQAIALWGYYLVAGVGVFLIYDVDKENLSEKEVSRIVRETSGIYKDIDEETESNKLRESWERNAHQMKLREKTF